MRDTDDDIRLDKWLWAARFFKTRSLAAQAIKGGKVHVNGSRVKASKEVAPGMTLEITSGECSRTVIVIAVSDKRGSASVAQALYQETADSQARNQLQREQARLLALAAPQQAGKPSKRDRRQIVRFTRKGE